MADVQPPPTYAEVILVDEQTKKPKFNPIWLKWFIDLVGTINGAGGTTIEHNSLTGLQGGAASEFFHLTDSEHTNLTDGGDTTLHFHAADRDATNITGAAGTYTPTLTGVANVDATTAYACQYLRVASRVVVSGKLDVDPTAGATLTQVGISLPIASNIGAVEEVGGTSFCTSLVQGAAVRGDPTNDRAEMIFLSATNANAAMYFIFMYKII